jgi:aminoglycoside 6'-N-acetyltransferase I
MIASVTGLSKVYMERAIQIRFAAKADAESWLAMRMALWPDANQDALRLEVGRYFVAHGEPLLPHCVFVADDHGKIVGMLELSLRPYADGCDSSPVPFVEAWYVVPDMRRSGVGGTLVKAAEQWALENGHIEMASDALLENSDSERAHKALGFEEVERAIRFRKELKR